MPVQRPAPPLLAALLAALLSVVGFIAVSPADAGTAEDEQLFVQLINQTRASAGLPPLTVHSELTGAARSWAASMAASDTLSHAPDISSGIGAPWIVLGENVGVHGVDDVRQLHDAFVASPAHYKNIVDPRFRYIGVGVVLTEGGKLWTTHRFMATAEPTVSTSPPTTAPTTVPATVDPTTSTTGPPAPQAANPVPTTTAAVPPSTSSAPASISSAPSRAAPGADRDDDHDNHNDDGRHDDDHDDDHGAGDEHASPVLDAGPGEPDVDTVEQMLIDLIEAGI